MIRLSFRVPIVHTEPSPLAQSPCCRAGLIRHQKKSRGLTDIRVGVVTVQRYRCKACGRTFTHRPRGVTRSSKSNRLKAAAILAYCLGLSYEATSRLLGALGAPLSKSSVYNYVRAAGHLARRLHRRAAAGMELLALGQDTTVYKVKGRKLIHCCIVDALSGKTVSLRFLRREDAHTLKACLQKVIGPRSKVLISDDAQAYRVVAEGLGLEHQLCLAHMKKALIRRSARILRDTPKEHPLYRSIRKDCRWLQKAMGRGKKVTVRLWKWARRRLPTYLGARPPGGGERASPQYRMRLMLTELVDYGLQLFTYRSVKDEKGRLMLDGTNNAAERSIGWTGKVRYRLMRGVKSGRSLLDFLHLNAVLRNHQLDGHTHFNLETLVA